MNGKLNIQTYYHFPEKNEYATADNEQESKGSFPQDRDVGAAQTHKDCECGRMCACGTTALSRFAQVRLSAPMNSAIHSRGDLLVRVHERVSSGKLACPSPGQLQMFGAV